MSVLPGSTKRALLLHGSPMIAHLHDLINWVAKYDRHTGAMPEWQHLEDDEAFLDELSGVELGECLAEAERMIRAARAVKTHVEEYLADDIAEHGAIRLGDSGYYIGSSTERKLINAEGLLDWLGDPDTIGKAVRVNTSNIRISFVKGYAEEEGIGWEAARDTFFEETTDEKKLRKVPAMKSKWVEKLEHGERR